MSARARLARLGRSRPESAPSLNDLRAAYRRDRDMTLATIPPHRPADTDAAADHDRSVCHLESAMRAAASGSWLTAAQGARDAAVAAARSAR